MASKVRHGYTLLSTAVMLAAMTGIQAAAKTVNITYTTWTADMVHEKGIIDQFMKQNPDIKVKMLNIPGGPPIYVEKILVSIIGGSSPDVMRLNHETIIPLYMAKGLLNLNSYIKQSKVDMRDYFEPNTRLFQFDGRQLGIPLSINNEAIYYNRRNTMEAGVPEISQTAASGNWNREAFMAIARKLTRDTNGDGRNDTWGIGDVPGWVSGIYIRQAGGNWYSPDGKKSVFNSPETVDGLNFIWDLRQTAKVWNPNSTWDSFWMKKSAMQIIAGWAIGSCIDKKLDFDVAPLFEYKAKKFMGATGDGMGISANSKNKAAAWRLVRFLTDHQASTYLTKSGTITPALIPVAKGEAFAKSPQPPRNRQAFFTTMDNTTVFEPRYVKNEKTVNSNVDTIMNSFYSGKKPPQQTAAEIQNIVNRLLGAK